MDIEEEEDSDEVSTTQFSLQHVSFIKLTTLSCGQNESSLSVAERGVQSMSVTILRRLVTSLPPIDKYHTPLTSVGRESSWLS